MKKIYLILILIAMASLSSHADVFTNYVLGTNYVMIAPKLVFCLANETSSKDSATQFNFDELIHRKIIGTDTNDVFFRVFPYDQTFEFQLTDAKGQVVQKTKKGLTMGKSTILPKNRLQVPESNGRIVSGDAADFRALFRPDEMFVITNKGVYDMEVRYRIYVPATNDAPDFSAMIDGHKFVVSKHFAVLTSPPLRVKIIK
jgi:hypothetical protein